MPDHSLMPYLDTENELDGVSDSHVQDVLSYFPELPS